MCYDAESQENADSRPKKAKTKKDYSTRFGEEHGLCRVVTLDLPGYAESRLAVGVCVSGKEPLAPVDTMRTRPGAWRLRSCGEVSAAR